MTTRRALANAIRALSMDAVQQANSGHPGMPMGMADIAEVLWNDFLQHNPTNPQWFNRDRFILSNGHGSMLQYALLHLTGYDLPMEEIKKFRQLHSKTPGHPEYGYTPGIETTTGPLGQGIANAVGMALAEKLLATHFNKPGHEIIDHHTYVFLGDGCLMEGISHEACAFAGTLGLGKLIAFWDDNGISIDGHVEGWFTDNTHPIVFARRLRAVGLWFWHPSLHKFHGCPTKSNSHECHGSPLGAEEIAAARKQLGWSYPAFEIPREIYAGWDAKTKGQQREAAWQKQWDAYEAAFPTEAAECERRLLGEFPDEWELTCAKALVDINQKAETIASRKASQNAINALAPMMPEFLGGSADLTGSNLTNAKNCKWITPKDFTGNYISYGVREFGMAALMNGMALHGGFIPFGGTFLVFTDYMRNAMRLSALMKQRVIYVLTHDSIGLGEDGPTHQPIEHVSSLRLIPNMSVWRPCDAVETFVSWQTAVERVDGPTSLILSRQNLPHQTRTPDALGNIAKGGYVLLDGVVNPEVILLATGSEVSIAMDAAKQLTTQGKKVRVVSMPCVDLFDKQSESYRQSVLIPGVPVVAIEAGVTSYWHKFVGPNGKVIGIDTFGESAPAGALYKHFGLTVEKVTAFFQKVL